MDAVLVYTPAVASYDLGPDHPLRPERFALAVELMDAYGLVPEGTANGAPSGGAAAPKGVRAPEPASDAQLLLAHSAKYISAVREAGDHPRRFGLPRAGLGTLDTPVFPGMHEASALVAGAAIGAFEHVLSSPGRRAFSVAGGLHHAHRDHAAGFCVYNDCAVGIASALADHPDLRVLYLDIDAHHGDGVQDIFWDEPRVLTVSIHETGLALYPGTGFARERGGRAAPCSAANVAMPPGATDACYRPAFEDAVLPLARRFAPDVIAAQCGADAHHDDPLTSLGLTLPGYRWLVRSIVALADELCAGRLAAFGGGGYGWEHVVPRAWTAAAAEIAGVGLPEELPAVWRERVRTVARIAPPLTLSEDRFAVAPAFEERLLADTRSAIAALMGPAADRA
jgi:acetoin utilization protein AcuC